MSTPTSLQERLHAAVKKGDTEAYFQALEDGADPLGRFPGVDQDLVDTACKAAFMNNEAKGGEAPRMVPIGEHTVIVEHLVRHAGLVPDEGHTGLLSAVASGHVELVQLMARLGYNPRAFNDRALDLAAEHDLRDRNIANPRGHYRTMIRALMSLGCTLDSGKGEARQKLTRSLMAEAQNRGVSVLNLPVLQDVWAEAERFGVTLSANGLLSKLVMTSHASQRTNRQDTGRSVDELAVELADALVARGGWTSSQGENGQGTNGAFAAFATKNGLIALFDRFVELGADPRLNDDNPLLNAAVAGQRAMVNHLVTWYGADLGACNGQIRVELRDALNETWVAAARIGNLTAMQADDAQAQAWGVALPAAHVFNSVTISTSPQSPACEDWLADRVEPSSWEEALRSQVAMGLTVRAQKWMDRLTANGQALSPDVEETLFVLAARKGHTDAIRWLMDQGLDLLTYGPAALNDLNDRAKPGDEPTVQWLANQIEQEQLRREIASVNPEVGTASPRRRL